jgi:alkanesulfonate monooxygenase SsuD/methylene tetrahydromethanopterin reductase-like flavin-dependent oxidoreductase (luciferase family)
MAETSGFDGVALIDHLDPPGAAGYPMFEAFGAATWLAAHTTRLTISHLVLCDSFRHPSLLARQAVTLDHLSGGRFELGLGIGSKPGDLDRFGLCRHDADTRAERLDETVRVLRGLWTGDPQHHDGKHYHLHGAQQLPTPLHHIPLVIGGVSERALALVRTHADWWNVPVRSLDRLDELRRAVGEARISALFQVGLVADESTRRDTIEAAIRRFGPLGTGTIIGNVDEVSQHISALAEQGVERCYVWFTDRARVDTIARFGSELIASFR